MNAAIRGSETVKALEVVVVKIIEQQLDQEAINIDNDLRSHELDEDYQTDEVHNVNASIMAEDEVSKEATSSEADAIFIEKEEDMSEVEDSSVTTETVEPVESVEDGENVDNLKPRRVPLKRSEWFAGWLMEAAEWEGRNWNRSLTRWNTL